MAAIADIRPSLSSNARTRHAKERNSSSVRWSQGYAFGGEIRGVCRCYLAVVTDFLDLSQVEWKWGSETKGTSNAFVLFSKGFREQIVGKGKDFKDRIVMTLKDLDNIPACNYSI